MTVGDLVTAAGSLHLLESAQQEQAASLATQFPQPRELARELLSRGWLTPYQINQLFLGKGNGLLLGSYVLLRRLGEGGMGEVFEARNWKLGQVVAVKMIRKDRLATPEMVRRFRREIRAVAQFSHPNVVRALDADEVGGVHFFVMEYVEGVSLAELVEQQGPQPIDRACDLVRQAALGLQHAHERDLIHRDVKPSNLLVARDGTLKILDFGLARFGPNADELSTTLTPEGRLMGTPDFMAPEQCLNSDNVDHRADVYSLGCAFYFLLTGRVPFPDGNLGQKIARHLAEEPVAVGRLRSDVPAGLSAVVRKMLAKRPEDRFQTAGGVAAVLQFNGERVTELPPESTVIEAPSPPVTEVRPVIEARSRLPRSGVSRRGLLIGAGLVVLLGGGSLGLALGLKRDDPANPTPTPSPPPKGRPTLALHQLDEASIVPEDLAAAGAEQAPEGLVAVLGDTRLDDKPVSAVAWSPDGGSIAAASLDGTLRLWLSVQGGRPHVLKQGDGHAIALAYSPKGSLAAACFDTYVRVWHLGKGRASVALRGHSGQARCVAWSPDGILLASGSTDKKVILWNANQGAIHEELPQANDLVSCVGYRPKGKELVRACYGGEVTVNPDDPKKTVTLPFDQRDVRAMAFSDDGRFLVLGYGDGTVALWDWEQQKRGAWVACHKGAITGMTFWPAGPGLVTHGADGMIRLSSLPDLALRKKIAVGPAGEAKGIGRIALSPDGRFLAISNDNGTIYVLRLIG